MPSSRGIITSLTTRSGGVGEGGLERRLPVARRRSTRVARREQPDAGTRACRRCRRRPARGRRRVRRPDASDPVGGGGIAGSSSVAGPRQPAQRLGDERAGRGRRPPAAVGARARPAAPAGRWAEPSGRRDGERGADVGRARRRSIVPPCRPTSSRTMARPMPLPSPERARASLDPVEPLEQPGQLLRRRRRCRCRATVSTATPVLRRAAATVIRPSKVNFSALESRLRTTFSHMSRST